MILSVNIPPVVGRARLILFDYMLDVPLTFFVSFPLEKHNQRLARR